MPEQAPPMDYDMDFLRTIDLEKLSDLFQKVNEKYVYWDKFKYISFPDDLPIEKLWSYFRMMREMQMKKIAMKDKALKRFGYWLPNEVQKTLHYVDQHAGGEIFAEGSTMPAGDAERYVVSSLMEEAIASSQLEGAATTRKKAKDMLRSGRRPANKAEQMILNNYNTMNNVRNLLDVPLSRELILEIQAMITKDTMENPSAVGCFRKEGDDIQVIDKRDGQLLHDPPIYSEIEERIERLCQFVNDENESTFIHPAIKAIILHFWLAYIHPFEDGNGRTARTLFYWYMLKKGYWLFEYLPISRIIKKAPVQYAKAYLYSEVDNLDLTYFLVFNLDVVNSAIKEFLSYLERKRKEIKKIEDFIKKHPGLNYRQSELLRHAIAHAEAVYTIKYHKNVHNVAYQTARNDLFELEEKGFLEKREIGKEFVYIPAKDMGSKLEEGMQ